MPRLFLGNFDFEYHLADPHFTPGRKLLEINLRFASAWFAIAEKGDYIWLPDIDAPLPQQLTELAELIGVHLVREGNLPTGPDIEFVPWGWLPYLEEYAVLHEWTCEMPTANSVQFGNSRTLSSVVDDFTIQLDETHDIEDGVEKLRSFDVPNHGWVMKPEYSMSGRNCLRGKSNSFSDMERSWIRDRLDHGPAFLEPWLDQVEESSLHWEIPINGAASFVGIAELVSDSRGQYVGSRVGNRGWSESKIPHWQETVHTCEQAMDAVTMLTRVYFGPLGIDAMKYRDANGQVKIRPIQDINARWTMGRLAVEYAKRFPPKVPILWTPENPLPHLRQ